MRGVEAKSRLAERGPENGRMAATWKAVLHCYELEKGKGKEDDGGPHICRIFLLLAMSDRPYDVLR